MNKSKDNRSYPRAIIDFDVEIKLFENSNPVFAKAYDISATGISLESDLELEEDHVFSLNIHLTEMGKEIPAKAHAVRSWEKDGKKYLSAHFMDIDYHDFILLLDYSLAYASASA